MIFNILKMFIACALLTALTSANAQTYANTTMQVDATVTPLCYMQIVSNNNFTITTPRSMVSSGATLQVHCSKTTPYTVIMGAGLNPDSNVAYRNMRHNTDPAAKLLRYTIITSGTYATTTYPVQNGTFVNTTGNGFGASQNVIIRSSVSTADSTGLTAGSYSDTVSVTISY